MPLTLSSYGNNIQTVYCQKNRTIVLFQKNICMSALTSFFFPDKDESQSEIIVKFKKTTNATLLCLLLGHSGLAMNDQKSLKVLVHITM